MNNTKLSIVDLPDDVLGEIIKEFTVIDKKRLKLVNRDFRNYINRNELGHYINFYQMFECTKNLENLENLSASLNDFKVHKFDYNNQISYLQRKENQILYKLSDMLYFFDMKWSDNLSVKNNILILTFDKEIFDIGIHLYNYEENFYLFYLNTLIAFNIGGYSLFNFKDIIEKCIILRDNTSFIACVKVNNKYYSIVKDYTNQFKLHKLQTLFDDGGDFLILQRIFNKDTKYRYVINFIYQKYKLIVSYDLSNYFEYFKAVYGIAHAKFLEEFHKKLNTDILSVLDFELLLKYFVR